MLPGPWADDRSLHRGEHRAGSLVGVGSNRLELPLVVGEPPVQEVSSLLLLDTRSVAHVTPTLLSALGLRARGQVLQMVSAHRAQPQVSRPVLDANLSVGPVGLEPTTKGLKVLCSAN